MSSARSWRARVLRDRESFDTVLRRGYRVSSRNFVVRALPNGLSQARLGIIAAKKVAPRAIDRNRGRRMVREAFRAAETTIQGMDVTIQLLDSLRREDPARVRVELTTLLMKLAERSPRRDQ